ncbi:MAG: hypothetical protein E7Z72_00590 [Methanocorpusculum parvum]|nr:hypothetical protein [Methanocorpusculum parvum]
MTRAHPLSDSQKRIIENNLGKWDKDICQLDGMAGTTPRQIADYRKRITRTSQSEHRQLAEHLQNYIRDNGLPSKYGAVISYIDYLQNKG